LGKVKGRLNSGDRKGGGLGRSRQVLGLFLATFVLATAFSLLSDSVLRSSTVYLAALVLVIIVSIGILFDIIGLAAATASRVSFNAMAAKRIPGARQALRLVQNAPRVAAFCNDLVGDIAGTVSGAAAAAIAFHAGLTGSGTTGGQPGSDGAGGLWTVLAVALVAAVTVGGKAAGKIIAIERADRIIFRVGRVLWWLEERLGLVLLGERPSRRKPGRRVDGR
jgi:CBS domain containing-hemolysin-like protein